MLLPSCITNAVYPGSEPVQHFLDIMPPLGTTESSPFPGQVTLRCIAINMLRWCGPGCQPLMSALC